MKDLDVLQYLGVDWAAMAFTFLAIYLLGNKSRMGFAVMMCGNACWMVVGILTASIALIVANAVFFLMSFRGWFRWGERDANRPSQKRS